MRQRRLPIMPRACRPPAVLRRFGRNPTSDPLPVPASIRRLRGRLPLPSPAVPRAGLRPLALAVALALASAAAAQSPAVTGSGAQAVPAASELRLRPERSLGAGRAAATRPRETPTFGSALRIEGEVEERIVFDGAAELRGATSVLRADRIVYTPPTDRLQAQGDVRLFRDGVLFTGPTLSLQVDAQAGSMPDATFSYAPRGVHGTSALIEFLEPGRMRFNDAVYTSCTAPDMAWWVQAERIDIDEDEQVGVARNGRLYFHDVPLLITPYFQFSLGDERRSGVLTPSFGVNTKLGIETTVPLYWNIAPNRDYTLSPRFMTRRGVLLQNEFRYLEPTWRGKVQYDVLPSDRVTGSSRDLLSLQHEWAAPSGLGAGLNYNRVSDDSYFSDFGTNIVVASQSILPQEGYLSFAQPYYNTALRVTKNQTLQDPLAPVTKPYERVPQFTFNALNTDWHGFDLQLATEAVRFDHPTLETGSRYIVNPSLAYPWLAPGWFVVPKVQWHATRYELDSALRPNASQLTRTLPIASLDAGLVFERDSSWLGQAVTQTLEPRLYYSYIPYRDQSSLPNFDSSLADFNFAQLFTENTFVGGDRIGEANQLTVAMVSRLLDPDSGAERLRAAIGQRYYNSPQRVTLPGGTERTDKSSDVLLALSGRLSRSWITDVALQHSTALNELVRATVGIRYQPRAASVLSFAYRYKLDELEQFDLAAQWPLTNRWYGVGRANYSTRDKAWIELLGGFEYKADCWVGRFAVHRYATTTGTYTTQFFFALELNGLGGVGPGPVEQLRRNIPGYQLINPPPATPGRFEYYE